MTRPPSVSTARLVEEAARRTPESVALIAAGETVTYAQLNRRADELAGRLTAAGAGPETPVAVRLPRSVEHVVATLAIWKAGGVSVPVDPALPAIRIDAMLGVTRAPLQLTADGLQRVAGTPEPTGAGGELGWTPPDDEGERVAYVFFTSGSTGVPKGVAIPHLGIVNEARWTEHALRLGPGERGSWLSAPGFAISRWELWSSLAAGTGVAIAPPGTEWDADAVRDWLVAAEVTWSIVVTGLGERLFAVRWPARVPLRLLVTGGERLRVRPQGLPFEVVNSYGITEASSVRLTATLGREPHDGTPPPIGEPIWNTYAYILDGAGREVADGDVGELHLGGLGLARGYVGDPAATAARFGPDPFRAGGRMYRTGDLVRRTGGGLQYVGRAGADVKIDGVRVNVGEVESVLLRHPAVGFAAAVVDDAGDAPARLVGYLTARAGHELDAADVRAFLAARLPRPLVPTVLVRLAAAPLLPSGKVDRAGLPAPTADNTLVEEHREPRDEWEATAVDVFRRVLGRPRIGVDDDFFVHGGDSLGLSRVVAELTARGRAAPPVEALFQARTPALVARLLRDAAGGAPAQLAGPAPGERRPDGSRLLPVSAFARGLWFLDRLNPGDTAYVELVLVRLTGPIDGAALHRALRRLVERQPALRTAFTTDGSGPVRLVCPAGATGPVPAELPVADLADETVVAELGRAGALHPFDLAQPPLFRLYLLRADADRAALALVIHHLVWDGESARVFLEELAEGYDAARLDPAERSMVDGAGGPVPELPVVAPDVDGLDEARRYWAARLDGAVPTVWPDFPVAGGTRRRCALVQRPVPADLARAARLRFAEDGCTPFMVGLAGLVLALAPYRYTGDDLVIGAATSVRPVAAQQSIDYFVNTLPLRLLVPRDVSARQFLAGVRDACLAAWTHRRLPFEEIVALAAPQRSVTGSPYTQVMFSYNRLPEEVRTADGVRWYLDWLPARQPKCDLEVAWNESADTAVLRVEYDDARVPAAVAEGIADALIGRVAELTADPDRRLTAMPGWPPAAPPARPAPAAANGAAAGNASAAVHGTNGAAAGPAGWPGEINRIWREALGVEDVSELDNFFELGGRSVSAAQVVTRVNRALGIDVPLRLLFVTDSFGEFVRAVVGADHGGTE